MRQPGRTSDCAVAKPMGPGRRDKICWSRMTTPAGALLDVASLRSSPASPPPRPSALLNITSATQSPPS